MIELSAQQLIDALDHVFDDRLGCVPDAEVFAELRVEGLKEWLVEVGNSLVFSEGVEECRLNAIEGVARKVEHFLKLDGVERAGFGNFAE